MLCSHGKGNAGYSIILDTLDHDRTILTHKGINDELKVEDVPFRKLKTKWFYFGAMMGESFHTLEKLVEFAQKKNIKIAFNPSTYLAEKGKSFLKHILSGTELLVLNKEEACLLAGKDSSENLLVKLKGLGPNIVAITDGQNPLFVIDSHYIYSARPPDIKRIDTTGAGDAFAASFLSGLMRKNDIEFAIKLGIINAQSVIAHYGAKNILLTYTEAMKFMGKSRIKVKKRRI